MVERYFGKHYASNLIKDEDVPWVKALKAIDKRRDKGPLLKLLRNKTPMSETARWHLADLINRYKIDKQANRGGKTTPSYDYPPAQLKLVRAKRYYDNFREQKMSKDPAIEEAAQRCEVEPETLRSFIDDKYTSGRRVKKRKPPQPRP